MIAIAKRLWRNDEGVAAVEFAIYSTAFFAMLFGGIYASILGFTSASMHEAVEAAARCYALGVTCTDATSAQTYAGSAFHNLTSSTPTFTASDQTCGKQVSGTLTYNLKWILASKSITISAQSCFPLQAASTS